METEKILYKTLDAWYKIISICAIFAIPIIYYQIKAMND